MTESIAVIVPTIGRPQSLDRLLASIAKQTAHVSEIVVADGSDSDETQGTVERWQKRGLPVRNLRLHPPNAVRQRVAAIGASVSE